MIDKGNQQKIKINEWKKDKEIDRDNFCWKCFAFIDDKGDDDESDAIKQYFLKVQVLFEICHDFLILFYVLR